MEGAYLILKNNNMKQTIITILLAIVAMVGQGQVKYVTVPESIVDT